MTTTTVTTWHLETILEGLEDAYKHVKNPEVLNEHGYAYCHGYLEATVSNAIYELKKVLENAQ